MQAGSAEHYKWQTIQFCGNLQEFCGRSFRGGLDINKTNQDKLCSCISKCILNVFIDSWFIAYDIHSFKDDWNVSGSEGDRDSSK